MLKVFFSPLAKMDLHKKKFTMGMTIRTSNPMGHKLIHNEIFYGPKVSFFIRDDFFMGSEMPDIHNKSTSRVSEP